MSKVKDLLVARRREIEAELGPLQAELEQIDAALSAIEPKTPTRKERRRTATKEKPRGTRTQREKAKRKRQPSIADQSRGLLEQNPQGLDTAEIARKLEESHGRKATMRTISTQLSALKRQGRLRQEGRLWRLPISKPEASDEEAEPARQET
ncbi:hypothetical protein [Chelativorans salis]|uniref:Uncharacterized protein n=1 Tax=Chelativorans salis TaxID=2978478 RepID=A0ABT2LV49_9HYPH|nr:hypothetical protein [Chelativorans sp. EGI FJ00035]MCT7377969.1 hypothetical protein [Chelativorans sp. EGI FJ00035]